MQKNTLNELNNKWWYRLIKVVYIILFLFIGTAGIALIIEDGLAEISLSGSEVICYSESGQEYWSTESKISLDTIGIGKNSLADSFDGKKLNYERLLKYNTGNATKIAVYCMNLQRNEDEKVNGTNEIDVLRFQKVRELEHGDHKILDKELKEKSFMSFYKALGDDPYDWNKTKNLDLSIHLFDIKPQFSYIQFIYYLFLLILGVGLIFELIRRVFYYIVLGTFLPKKD